LPKHDLSEKLTTNLLPYFFLKIRQFNLLKIIVNFCLTKKLADIYCCCIIYKNNTTTTSGDRMSNQIILKKFKELGLTTSEAKSYLSLLERDTVTVTEVARLAKIPRANAYEALEKLMTKGFCISRPGKIRQYSALDPSLLEERAFLNIDTNYETEVIRLKEMQDQILAERKAARERLATLAKELKPLYEKSRSNENPLEYIEIIKEPYLIHKKFVELVESAKFEILIFSKPPYTGPKEVLAEQTEKQSDPLRRGIEIKSLYEIPAERNELSWWYDDIEAAAKLGEHARVTQKLPIKMVIVDETAVMLPLEDPISSGTSFTAQLIRHSALAKTLKITFETLWGQSDDYRSIESSIRNAH
jgi:HTH-type transcriptional regulator, sugar sensing transcriptional regulator